MKNDQVVIAFVPVLHAGYIRFFNKHKGASLFLLAPSLYGEKEPLTREIRALDPETAKKAIDSLGIFASVEIMDLSVLCNLDQNCQIVMPAEDICRHIKDKYLPARNVQFESVFLRYDLPSAFKQNPVKPDSVVHITDLDRRLMGVAHSMALRSPDWWRQVGAVLVQNSVILDVAYNKHMPSQHSLYALGDPRNNFTPGEHLEISAAHHAEKVLISRAAAKGNCTSGASIYVSTFPCPPCAYDIVTAGIRKVYYSEGYSSLAAQKLFALRGVELIRVADEN
ncbi:hypothetical protein IPM19_02740 [bacterium]|nr:MAG: hypothetical protein IPM19_02740 [bacterium]